MEEILAVLYDRADEVRALRRAVAAPEAVATRTRFAAPTPATILLDAVTQEAHPVTGEVLLRRAGRPRPTPMLEYGTFEAAETATPARAYLVPDTARAALAALRAHGFAVRAAPATVRAERFALDSTRVARFPFQGVRERTVWGRYAPVATVPGTGWMEVSAPRAALVPLLAVLLEPRSEDGLTAWGFFEAALAAPGATLHPIARVR